MSESTFTQEVNDWVIQKKAAASLITSRGKLLLDKGVDLVLYRNSLINIGISQVLQLHDYAKHFVNKPIDIFITSKLAEIMTEMDLAPSKLDIGKLAREWMDESSSYENQKAFLEDKLQGFLGHQVSSDIKPKDVVLYGFGRIGRLCARELIMMAGKGQQLRLRAIVTRNNNPDQIKKRADLFRMDSVHGPFPGVVEIDAENRCLIINGYNVQMIAANDPAAIDYTAFGINDALLIDNTGVWRDDEGLSLHTQSQGITNVLLTAPGKNVPNIVYGVNHKEFGIDDHKLWSAASCTTNAISPVLKVINDTLGIVKGHVETIHSYTNDQNLLDNMHKKHRRGRSAAVNMVITETGAAKAVAIVLPELAGKLTANAVRVPTPNGSLAIMHLEVNKETSEEEVKEIMKNAALEGKLVNQIKYSTENELVSNDIIGDSCCSVFDAPATKVSHDKKSVLLYTWYDNEFGYTKQVLRLSKYIAKVRRLTYY